LSPTDTELTTRELLHLNSTAEGWKSRRCVTLDPSKEQASDDTVHRGPEPSPTPRSVTRQAHALVPLHMRASSRPPAQALTSSGQSSLDSHLLESPAACHGSSSGLERTAHPVPRADIQRPRAADTSATRHAQFTSSSAHFVRSHTRLVSSSQRPQLCRALD
jgi:hypothetical protein